MEYYGWTNWETWNFKLWIDNDERLHNLINITATALVDDEGAFAKKLEFIADKIVGTELCMDLKKVNIAGINFKEIAEAILEEI